MRERRVSTVSLLSGVTMRSNSSISAMTLLLRLTFSSNWASRALSWFLSSLNGWISSASLSFSLSILASRASTCLLCASSSYDFPERGTADSADCWPSSWSILRKSSDSCPNKPRTMLPEMSSLPVCSIPFIMRANLRSSCAFASAERSLEEPEMALSTSFCLADIASFLGCTVRYALCPNSSKVDCTRSSSHSSSMSSLFR
mmetsp:Transcript_55564/g.92311  ORF Transcript_55564/g.92311 Transcript_55564/m.92311 type:complete len:202 (-) Transcript_55564:174-779(-)